MIANETILDRRPNDVVNNFRSFKDEQNLYRTKGTEMIQNPKTIQTRICKQTIQSPTISKAQRENRRL